MVYDVHPMDASEQKHLLCDSGFSDRAILGPMRRFMCGKRRARAARTYGSEIKFAQSVDGVDGDKRCAI